MAAKNTDSEDNNSNNKSEEASSSSSTTNGSSESKKKKKESTTDGDQCSLPWEDEETTALDKFQQQQDASQRLDRFINLIPFVAPFLAYLGYESVAQVADDLADLLASRNFVEVDGGSYRAQIIAPAINGIVIPSCVVTFATLLSITISFLRQRQQDIGTTINQEAGEIRVLQALVDAFPEGPAQDKCRNYLIQYTSRLIAESQPSARIDTLVATSGESEMNGFLTQLIQTPDIREDLRAQAYSAVARLNSERSARISVLQSRFPPLHYAILAVLAMSVCACYLLETDQDILVFLYSVQLKFLWAILVGVYVGFGVVVYDLIDPFQGSYQVSGTVSQLYTIRSSLEVSMCGDRSNGNNGSRTNGSAKTAIAKATTMISNLTTNGES